MFKTDALTAMPVADLLTRAKDELARMSLDMVAALSAQESRSEQLATENERLATEALTDPLTQLYNRRAFDRAIARSRWPAHADQWTSRSAPASGVPTRRRSAS